MSDPVISITDTETGGLDPTRNPLLSVATLLCDQKVDEVAHYYTTIRPPVGVLLEIPAPGSRFLGNYRAPIIGWYDVHARTTHETKPIGNIIAAAAAMVNGFIKPDADGSFENWDVHSTQQWMDESLDLLDADKELTTFLLRYFPAGNPVNIAYNVNFDVKFMQHHMPLAFAAMGPTWVCAMESTKKAVQARDPKAKSGWKLSDAAKLAGVVNPNAHEALGDVRTTRPVVQWLQANGFM